MASLCRAQISFPLYSGGSGQHATNTLYFSDSFAADNVIDTAVSNNTRVAVAAKIPAAWATLATLLSQNLVNPGTLTLYDMLDPEPRYPIYQAEFSTTKASGSFPAEVALVMSYQRNMQSGVPRARRKGRIYLGPIAVGMGVGGAAAVPNRPSSSITTVLTNFTAVLFNTATYEDSVWVQYSPTTGTFSFVQQVSYDDAWDTQRRRGAPPASRVQIVVP